MILVPREKKGRGFKYLPGKYKIVNLIPGLKKKKKIKPGDVA